jgi:hypothetical protein
MSDQVNNQLALLFAQANGFIAVIVQNVVQIGLNIAINIGPIS